MQYSHTNKYVSENKILLLLPYICVQSIYLSIYLQIADPASDSNIETNETIWIVFKSVNVSSQRNKLLKITFRITRHQNYQNCLDENPGSSGCKAYTPRRLPVICGAQRSSTGKMASRYPCGLGKCQPSRPPCMAQRARTKDQLWIHTMEKYTCHHGLALLKVPQKHPGIRRGFLSIPV